MISRILKRIAAGAISLVVTVITLAPMGFAATSPAVTALSPVSEGLRAPVKLAMDSTGNYYVADQRRGVVKYNRFGAAVLTIKTAGVPAGVAIASDGSLLVSQGSFVAAYNTTDGAETSRFSGKLKGAAGLAVDDVTGFIYVADSSANEIQMYTASGKYSKSFGIGSRTSYLLPEGQLSMPTGIVFEKLARHLVVSDTLNNRIQFFDTNGVYVKKIGTAISSMVGADAGPMQFAMPQSVAFEYSKDATPVVSRMYVVSTFKSNIQVVNPAGTGSALNVVGRTDNYIGSFGTANGQLMVPSDAVFDQKTGRLIVVNGYGNLTIYGIDGGTSPVDLPSPTLTVDPVLLTVNVPSITLSGTYGSATEIKVSSNTTATAGPVSLSGTTWSCTISGLIEGANTLIVKAVNGNGESTPAQTVSVSYVMPAPSLTVSAPTPAVTKVANIVLTGFVAEGASVSVTNTVTAATGNAVVNGTTWNYTAVLTEGANNFTVTAQKGLSAKANVTANVTLDTVSPLLSVSALLNNSYTSTLVQNISGSFIDTGAVSVTVNGKAAALIGNTFSVPLTLVSGKNQVVVTATDAAGNTVADVRNINFDISKPIITVITPMDNSYVSNARLTLSGTVDKASTTITVGGVPALIDAANNWNGTFNLVAGSNDIQIVATDALGNTSAAKRSVTLDAVNPVVAIVTPAQDSSFNKPNITVSGITDDVSATLTYTVNGKTAPLTLVEKAFSFNVDFVAEGVYPVILTAVDLAGNTTKATRNLIYDITPPELVLKASTSAVPEKIGGTVEAGASVVVKEGTVQVGTVTASGTTWSASLSGVNYDPALLSVVATDAAGNSSVKPLIYNFPDGTLNGSGKPTIQDALRAIRLVVKNVVPTTEELAHYDIGPLLNGKPNPNGKIDLADAILILRKSLKLSSW